MKTISFFSFKGGVGRTSLMANLGAYWAAQGKVVMLMDLDLAAPGLSYSIPDKEMDEQSLDLGMSEVLQDFFDGLKENKPDINFQPIKRLVRRVALPLDPPAKKVNERINHHMYLLPAGDTHLTIENSIVKAMDDLMPPVPSSEPEPDEDEERTIRRGFAYYLKKDLNEWTVPDGPAQGRHIDYLLIDSRTGSAELIDLSLGYLADEMVLVSGLNKQNLHGLEKTLEALREKRIPKGEFSVYVTLVYSPLPLSEDEALFERMKLAHGTVAECLRKMLSGREIAPEPFYVHYTPIIALREALPVIEYPESLYAKEVKAIAEYLDSRSLPDAQDRLLEEARRKAMATKTGPLPMERVETKVPEGPIRSNLLADPPPWYWPLPKDRQSDAARGEVLNRLMPDNPVIELDRETFANRLSWNILAIDEKRRMMAAIPHSSQDQTDVLIKRFENEQTRAMKKWMDQPQLRGDLFRDYFDHQRQWAGLVLGSEKEGDLRFLKAPGLGEPLFPDWEAWPDYWLRLARDLFRRQDGDSGLAMVDRAVGLTREKVEVAERLLVIIEPGEISGPILTAVENHVREMAPDDLWLNYHLARHYLKQSRPDIQAAQALLSPLLDHPPDDARRCYDLAALVLDELPQLADRTEPVLRKSISLDDRYDYPWNGLGNLLQDHLDRYEEAEEAYRQAIKLDDKDAYPWNGLGSLLQDHLGRYEEAEEAYRQAIKLDDKFVYPWNNLGNLLQYDLGRYEEAEEAYRRAISLDDKDAFPWNGLGNLLKNHLSRYEEAEEAYRRATSLDDKSAFPWNGLGNLLKNHLSRYEEAEEAYRRAISLDDKFASPWLALGNLLTVHLGRYEEAEEAYRRAIKLDDKLASPWNSLGNLLHGHLGRYEEAEDAYRQAVKLDDKFAAPWYGLGNLLQYRLKRYEEAEEAYRQAIKLDDKDASLWNWLGQLLHGHLGRYEEAEEAYRQAIKLDDKDASLWNWLGLLQRDAYRDCAGSKETFEYGLTMDDLTADPYLHVNLGHLLLDMGRVEPGRRHLTLALEGFAGRDEFGSDVLLPAVELADEELIRKHLAAAEVAAANGEIWPAFYLLLNAVARQDATAGEEWRRRSWALMDGYDDHFYALKYLYHLAGLRPETREQAAKLAAELLTFPEEMTARFKDVRKPEEWYDRFRPFAEGRSRGLGDPADRHLFCRDAAEEEVAPDQPNHEVKHDQDNRPA
ncbi:MAG: tetratricopeptide repeat protein [Deltaproteobacteria bacterium]|nr:tetratricopeptide repeat protein [Deltaproteobacteria bacterium]